MAQYRLKSRQRQIPNGLKWTEAQTGWSAPRFGSFDAIVRSLLHHRRANPHVVKQHNLPTDYASVANEVDAYNALLCARHGWTEYITDSSEGNAPPKSQALLQQKRNVIAVAAGKAKKIWGGIRTNFDWVDSGTPSVSQEKSNERARICSLCPENGKGDFTSWFTRPASDVILKQIESVRSRRLRTDHDDKINVCNRCLCPLKVKVHVPLEYIKAHLSSETLDDLRPVKNCWIISELEA